jgi:hypothetical protein
MLWQNYRRCAVNSRNPSLSLSTKVVVSMVDPALTIAANAWRFVPFMPSDQWIMGFPSITTFARGAVDVPWLVPQMLSGWFNHLRMSC